MKPIFPPFSPAPLTHYWSRFRQYIIAILIFILGLLITYGAFHFYQKQDLKRAHIEFNRIADLRLFLVKDIITHQTIIPLESLQQFFITSKEVTENSFQLLAHNILTFNPNYLAIGWIQPDSINSKQNLIVGLNFLNQSDEGPSHKHFFPFTYYAQSHLHSKIDVDSKYYNQFIKLLKQSQISPNILVSERVDYFENGREQGFFLFTPVFSKKKSNPLTTEYLGTIVGFSSFANSINLMRNQVEHREINITIYEVTSGKRLLLYKSVPYEQLIESSKSQKEWTRTQVIKMGNQMWEIQATPASHFIPLHQEELWPHWEVPLLGFLLSALLASYYLVLVNRRVRIEKEVQDRTNELANINSMLQQEIHERQRIEEDFMSKQNYLQRRHEALKYLTKLTASEPRGAIQEVILRTAHVMQVNRVGVWFYNSIDQLQTLSCAGLYILSSNTFSNHLEINSIHFPRYFEALTQHSHLILPSPDDAELNRELSSYLAAFQINSKLDIPIVFEGKLLGILSCEETRGYRNWILEDRHFGQTIADIIAIMIEQAGRRKAEKALQESEERLRFITQRSIDGIITVNSNEEIVSWNYGAQQIFGYSEEEILGKLLQEVLPHDLSLLREEISLKPTELNGRHRDGHLFPVELSHTRWESKDSYFDTIIVRDITERKEYEKRLIKAMRDANAANAAKSHFLATISHELRTPLNAIIGFNQCVLMGMDGPINLSQQESLQKIEKSSFHLLNLINDILDWSKIEAKKMEIEALPQNIVELIESCIEEINPIAQQKNLNIELDVKDSFILVEIDRMRIRQVLLNLLSNAVKFTEKGFIKIALINSPNQIEIQITDTGIGLSAEEIEKIFHPFSQADSSITRRYGGSGLGLVISKNIISLHNGKIFVKSEKGKGSTFTIILPKEQS